MKIDASRYIANMHKKDQKALVSYLCNFLLQVTQKNGEFYPPTKLPFPFMVDFYFSKFLMYFSFLIIFSFYCNIILCIRSSNKVTRGLQCYFDIEIKAKVQHKD